MPSDTHAPARPPPPATASGRPPWPPCDEGIAGISARSIARHGGFNQALIFYHFRSVDALLVAVARSESAPLDSLRRGAARGRLAGRAGGGGQAPARRGVPGRHGRRADPDAGRSGRRAALAQGIRDAFEPWTALVGETIDRLLDGTPYAGVLPAADLTTAVTALFLGIELLVGSTPTPRPATGCSAPWSPWPGWSTRCSVGGALIGTVGWPDGRHPPSGIAVDELSPDIRPQDDLFRHVNSRWLAETEIPADRAAHGAPHCATRPSSTCAPWPRRPPPVTPPPAATSARSATCGRRSWTPTGPSSATPSRWPATWPTSGP